MATKGMTDTVKCSDHLFIRIKPAGQAGYPPCQQEGCDEPGVFFLKNEGCSLCHEHAIQHLGEK
jgi:hypothetical protein